MAPCSCRAVHEQVARRLLRGSQEAGPHSNRNPLAGTLRQDIQPPEP